MVMTDYDQLIREYFDLSDVATRQMIVSVNEDNQQTQLLNALSSALYARKERVPRKGKILCSRRYRLYRKNHRNSLYYRNVRLA